jgi:NadR type nicotinamide-nucleotide adenylyltransferase
MKIAVTGPESSGKTTLTEHLAKVLDAPFVHEFARDYLTNLNRNYTIDDLVDIAKGQIESWKRFEDSPLLISDTELLVIKVWSEFKFGKVDSFILDQFEQQQFDLYLLCKPDLPWEEDPLREHPEQRDELYTIYHAELIHRKLPFVVIEGANEKRIEVALSAIERLKSSR